MKLPQGQLPKIPELGQGDTPLETLEGLFALGPKQGVTLPLYPPLRGETSKNSLMVMCNLIDDDNGKRSSTRRKEVRTIIRQ